MPIKYNFLDLSLAIIFQVKIGQPLKTQKKPLITFCNQGLLLSAIEL